MRNVTFPNFGIDININPIAFSVGSIHVHWYAIIIVVGLLLAMFYCFKRAKFFGVDLDRLIAVSYTHLMTGKELNKRGIESLIKCGAFDHLGNTRRELLESYEALIDYIDQSNRCLLYTSRCV